MITEETEEKGMKSRPVVIKIEVVEILPVKKEVSQDDLRGRLVKENIDIIMLHHIEPWNPLLGRIYGEMAM